MLFKSQEDKDAFCKQIAQVSLRWGRPIWWYDWQQPFERLRITGASCFVLGFKTGYIGVTAAHVVNQLFEARRGPLGSARRGHQMRRRGLIILLGAAALLIADFAGDFPRNPQASRPAASSSSRWRQSMQM
jgi:hypothetical protein